MPDSYTGVNVKINSITVQNIISFAYTLSTGISPSIATIVMADSGEARLSNDMKFIDDIEITDGIEILVLKSCLRVNSRYDKSRDGCLWTLYYQDARWQWARTFIIGKYNFGLDDGEEPPAGTLESKSRMNAQDLATRLLWALGEVQFDVSVFPNNDYPEAIWEYANPANELAKLCDRYEIVLAFDPFAEVGCRVSFFPRGRGMSVNIAGLSVINWSTTNKKIIPPEKIIVVTECAEHEDDLLLEAVGIDVDNQIKTLANLSYKPAAGWTDIKTFECVTASNYARALAQKSVFKMFRIVDMQTICGWPKENPGGTLTYGGDNPEPAALNDMLPATGKLTERITQLNRTFRREPYMHGIYYQVKHSIDGNNTAAGTKYDGNIEFDEKTGIVHTGIPVYANGPTEPTLYLRATVNSRHYIRTREYQLPEMHGVRIIPCQGIILQFWDTKNVVDVNEPTREAGNNQLAVNALLDRIIDLKESEFAYYGALRESETKIAGIKKIPTNGLNLQVSWTVDAGGAFTTWSENSEHSDIVPSWLQRRDFELRRIAVGEVLTPKGDVEDDYIGGENGDIGGEEGVL